MAKTKSAQLWGGRFDGPSDPLFNAFNDSLPFDYRLAEQDIAGSIAWAGAIARAGVLTSPEYTRLVKALNELQKLVKKNPMLVAASGQEDVHSFVESWLVAKVGTLGKKLHTGRSRNDQVATDLRLWTREEIDSRINELRALNSALISLAEREIETIIPGYTHVQRAQPVLAAHWALAYVEMLE